MRWPSLLGAALAVCLAAAPGQAQQRRESEESALTRLRRDFSRLGGYRMTVAVEGGLARGAEHALVQVKVNEAFSAEVFRGITHLTAPCEAFRGLAAGRNVKGAILGDGRWQHLLTQPQGRLFDRLVEAPESLLAKAHGLRSRARWVDPAAPAGGPPGVVPGGDEDEEGAGSRTRDDEQGGESQTAPLSHHLRVVGTPEVALEHFISITNSGCFAEG